MLHQEEDKKLNDNHLSWGLIKPDQLEMIMGRSKKGHLNLELCCFTSEAGLAYAGYAEYFSSHIEIRALGRYKDVSGYRIIKKVKKEFKGITPDGFRIFESLAEYGEVQRCDARHKATLSLMECMKSGGVPEINVVLVVREGYGDSVEDTLYFLSDSNTIRD